VQQFVWVSFHNATAMILPPTLHVFCARHVHKHSVPLCLLKLMLFHGARALVTSSSKMDPLSPHLDQMNYVSEHVGRTESRFLGLLISDY
jgi:hypothetical protein